MIEILKIEFKGAESVEVSGEHVKQFKNIDNFYLGENGDMIEARKLVIVLDKNANKEYNDGFMKYKMKNQSILYLQIMKMIDVETIKISTQRLTRMETCTF